MLVLHVSAVSDLVISYPNPTQLLNYIIRLLNYRAFSGPCSFITLFLYVLTAIHSLICPPALTAVSHEHASNIVPIYIIKPGPVGSVHCSLCRKRKGRPELRTEPGTSQILDG